MKGDQGAIAIDTKKDYTEIALGKRSAKDQVWTAPYRSDWAIALGVSGSENPPHPNTNPPGKPFDIKVE